MIGIGYDIYGWESFLTIIIVVIIVIGGASVLSLSRLKL